MSKTDVICNNFVVICNNKYCLYFSIKRLVFRVVFDRQEKYKVDLKGHNDFRSFLGTTYYLFEIKILHEKLSERVISDSRKEFQI